MPNLIARQPVEGYRLTGEQKAFYKNFKRVNQALKTVKMGLRFQAEKLRGLGAIAQQIEGQKKELLLRAPDQSVLDAEDEGMIDTSRLKLNY